MQGIFKNLEQGDIITDKAGYKYIRLTTVAEKILECSLPVMRGFHQENGLRPLRRRVQRCKVFLLEDVEKYFFARQ